MAKIGFFGCLIIVAMDVAAGILSIEAEIARNKVIKTRVWSEFDCREPSHKAFKLGLAAAVLLGLAHVLANLFGGCMCVYSPVEFEKSSANMKLSFASLILSWITMAVGFPMVIIGTLANSKSKGSCGISHHHLLSVGGILSFVHGLFCIAYYISATASCRK